jgi:ATP/ADP translocase
MHRTIGYLSKRFTQIRPGEGRRVFLTFLYFFLIITAYYLIKPVSRSLILGELGSRMVPYVDLIAAILMGPIVTLFARLVDRVGKQQLVSGSFWAVIGLLLFFWGLLFRHMPWAAGVFYVWVAVFSVLVVTLFWLVANDLYRPREAKRLFGFIGSGGILGGIVGSSIAALGAQVVGTENLLLLSAGVLVCCWAVVQRLWALAPAKPDAAEPPAPRARRESVFSDLGGFIRMLTQSRYLLLLVAMVGLNKLVATLVYYQLNPFIEQAFPDQDARTTFMGMFLGGVNTAAFVVQFFCTSWVLRRWGLLPALLVLPAGLLTGSIGLIIWPVFAFAAATELFDGSLNYSLQQTTKEVLYLPIDRSIRYKVKPFIDMVVFRFGKGIAAVIGIVLLSGFHAPPQTLSLLVIPLVAAWLLVSVWLRRDYVTRIRVILQVRAAARGQPHSQPAEAFDPWLGGRHSAKKLALVDRLLGAEGERSLLVRELVAELSEYETLPSGVVVDGPPSQLKALITDPSTPMARRRQAVHRLSRMKDQASVDYLLGLILVEEEAVLRHEAVRGLLRLRLARARLDFPVQPIRRQIVREVANYQRILHVAAIYHQHLRRPMEPNDPVVAMLQVLMEESVEQIFHLLMLLYRPEDIRLIYEQLRADEGYLRADAIELLDNLVDPHMRSAIFPILDEDRFLELDAERGMVQDPTAAYRLLQGAIWDHNCWLSVTTLCAVGRLRLTTMRQELERASAHSASVISKAAQLALQIATPT